MHTRMKRPARFEPPQPTELDPRPVRLVHGAPLPPHTQSVAPPTKWVRRQANPASWLSQAAAVVDYAVWIAGRADLLAAARAELVGADLACECPTEVPCHRDVLLDIANAPADLYFARGRALGLTVRRPWASLLLVPKRLGGNGIHTATWSTDYRGPICIYAGNLITEAGVTAARTAGLDADWHTRQRGWLGAAVLVDVHRVRPHCCQAARRTADRSVYHWVFKSPGRLALPTCGRGFTGLRPVSWAALVRRSARNTMSDITGTVNQPNQIVGAHQ
jgi:Domain of unknown function (DUF4326)